MFTNYFSALHCTKLATPFFDFDLSIGLNVDYHAPTLVYLFYCQLRYTFDSAITPYGALDFNCNVGMITYTPLLCVVNF